MGILQKRCRTTAQKALAYWGKRGQNTGTDFPALRLRVVLDLLIIAILVDQGHFTKGMFVKPGGFVNVLSQSSDSVTCVALGRGKVWHLVRYQRDTRKAL